MENREIEAAHLLDLIIEKGGLIGRCARAYKGMPIETDIYLHECFEQCHVESVRQYWGNELISGIIEYNNTYNHGKISLQQKYKAYEKKIRT